MDAFFPAAGAEMGVEKRGTVVKSEWKTETLGGGCF